MRRCQGDRNGQPVAPWHPLQEPIQLLARADQVVEVQLPGGRALLLPGVDAALERALHLHDELADQRAAPWGPRVRPGRPSIGHGQQIEGRQALLRRDPRRELCDELRILKSLLPWLFELFEHGIPNAWLEGPPRYVDRHAFLVLTSNFLWIVGAEHQVGDGDVE